MDFRARRPHARALSRAFAATPLALAAACATASPPRASTAPPVASAPAPASASAPARAPALPPGAVTFDGYRFALAPANGWRVEAAEQTRRSHPNIAAAAHSPTQSDVGAVVTVEPAPGMRLEQYANLLGRMRVLEQPRVLARESIRFAGEEAVRLVYDGYRESVPMHAFELVFLHQGWAYRIVCTGMHLDRVLAQSFFNAFTLLPGAVAPPPPPSPQDLAEADGVGWRVRARRFESADSGLSVDPGPRWHLRPESELRTDREAELGLASDEVDASMTVTPERAAPAEHLRAIDAAEARYRAWAGDPTGAEPVLVPFVGRPFALTTFLHDDMEVLHDTRCEGELCVQLAVTYPRGAAARARRLLAEAPPAIALLDPRARAALAASLVATAPRTRQAGLDSSLRGRRYVHYGAGVELELPADAFWRLEAGDDANDANGDVRVRLRERGLGLTALLMVEVLPRPATLARYHAGVLAVMRLRPAPGAAPREVHAGSVAALESEAQGELPGEPGVFGYRVVTAVRGPASYRLVVQGTPDNLAAGRAAIDALVAGLRVSSAPLAATERVGDRWIDHQYGFAIRVRPDWQQRDETDPALRGVGRVRSFSNNDEGLTVMTVATPLDVSQERSRAIQMAAFEEVVRALPGAPADVRWEPATVAGRAAHSLAWSFGGQRIESLALVADHTGYLVMSHASTGAGGANANELARSFELLE